MKKNILVIIAIITILGCAIQNNSPKSKKSSFKIFSRYGEIKYNEMIEQLQSADVIFFGDYKEDAFLHSLEKKFLSDLSINNEITLSLEIFEKDTQVYLNSYLDNEIGENQFKIQARILDNYDEDFSSIVKFAKAEEIDILAGNIPQRLGRKVHLKGLSILDSLSQSERKLVATNPKIINDNYKKKYFSVLKQNMRLGENIPPQALTLMNSMYRKLSIEDDTMAESIHQYIKQNPKKKVLHINNFFRSDFYLGTVKKLQLLNPQLKIAVISPVQIPFNIDLHVPSLKKGSGDFIVSYRTDSILKVAKTKKKKLEELNILEHNINLIIDEKAKTYIATDKILFNRNYNSKDILYFDEKIMINKIVGKNKVLQFVQKKSNNQKKVQIIDEDGINEIIVKYEGSYFSESKNEIYFQKHKWYPIVDNQFSKYNVEAICPGGYSLISSGKLSQQILSEEQQIFKWESEIPLKSNEIIGNRYLHEKEEVAGVSFGVYHLERNNKLALDNLKQLTEYYKTYKELLGDFPFSSFNLVESNHITNLDNASYSTIAPRNFKNQSKFKNELLEKLIRNWIAKSTYTKGKSKMWQNAFITFLVQYYPLKNTTGAKKWREKIMEETNFVNLSLDKKKQTSYKKVIFLLIEMHKKMGEEDFFYVFKSFINSYRGSEASWEDIQLFFSMKEFAQQKEIFEFYLNENEILDITLEHISVFQDTLKFAITQNNSPQTIHLPIKITTKNNELDKEILIDKAQNQFEYFIDDKILELEIDPNSEILKKTVNEPKKLHWIAK